MGENNGQKCEHNLPRPNHLSHSFLPPHTCTLLLLTITSSPENISSPDGVNAAGVPALSSPLPSLTPALSASLTCPHPLPTHITLPLLYTFSLSFLAFFPSPPPPHPLLYIYWFHSLLIYPLPSSLLRTCTQTRLNPDTPPDWDCATVWRLPPSTVELLPSADERLHLPLLNVWEVSPQPVSPAARNREERPKVHPKGTCAIRIRLQ